MGKQIAILRRELLDKLYYTLTPCHVWAKHSVRAMLAIVLALTLVECNEVVSGVGVGGLGKEI